MLKKCACLASIVAALILTSLAAPSTRGQSVEGAGRAGDLSNRYRIVPNVTYLTANNWDAKLDVYVPREVSAPSPTLIYIHGGGWVGGAKETSWLQLVPYLEAGWSGPIRPFGISWASTTLTVRASRKSPSSNRIHDSA